MLLLRSQDFVTDRTEILGKQCPRELTKYAPRLCTSLLAASSDLWNSALEAIRTMQAEKLATSRCLCASPCSPLDQKGLPPLATILPLLFRFLTSAHGPLYFADDVTQGMPSLPFALYVAANNNAYSTESCGGQ